MPDDTFKIKLERAKAKELALARLKCRKNPSATEIPKIAGETIRLPDRCRVGNMFESSLFKQENEHYNSPLVVKEESKDEDGNIPNQNVLRSKKYEGLLFANKRKRHVNTTNLPLIEIPTQKTTLKKYKDQELGERPFAPSKKPKRYPSSYKTITPVETRSTLHSSKWYEDIDMKQKYSRSDLETIRYLNFLIRQIADQPPESREPLFATLRQRIHQMEFYDFLSGALIKKSKILEDEGLPTIFESTNGVRYPFDLKADAFALHQRWLVGRLDPHLLAGISTNQKKSSTGKEIKSHSLQRDYHGKLSCNYLGQGNLQNGQWWPLQICAMRDGAHGEVEAGIHGQPQNGAYSIVLSSGGYSDVDDGETIKYCGTSGVHGEATASTKYLQTSLKLGNPVRVLRSAALIAKNPYRPSKGLRYDGLYNVIGCAVIDKDTAMCQFTLIRRPKQHPIRFQGVQQRPTREELAQYAKIRKLLGLGS